MEKRKTKKLLAIAFALVTTVLVGMASANTGEAESKAWTRWGYDLAQNHYYPHPSTTQVSISDFSESWSIPNRASVLTEDINGDGLLENVLTDGSALRAYDHTGTELWNTTTESSIQLIADVTGDGVPEIITSQLSGSTLQMHVYNTVGALLKTISRSCTCHSALWPVAAVDFDDDGNIEILASMGSNCGHPRGVSLFDYNSGTEEWHYDVGPWPIRGTYGDINEDGIMDVVMGGSTVNNGHTGCGVKNTATCTSDSSFYTIVFSAVDGTEIFTKKYSAGSVYHAIVDLDHDSDYNILAFEGHDSNYYHGTSKVSLIDSAGTILKTWSGPNDISLNDYAIGDLNNDGYDEIAFVGGDNVLRILDHNFNLLASTPSYKRSAHSSPVVVITDIDGDGTNELLAQDLDHSMVRVFDVTLTELGNFSIANPYAIIISDLDNDGVNEVICTGDTEVKVFTAEPTTPTVAVTTDKTTYTAGDTMNVEIEVANPTEDRLALQWWWLVPQYSVCVPVTPIPVSIPAGYDETLEYSFAIPNWGATGFGNVFYVQLAEEAGAGGGGEVLDVGTAGWIYSPSREAGTEATPTPVEEAKIANEIKRTVERIG